MSRSVASPMPARWPSACGWQQPQKARMACPSPRHQPQLSDLQTPDLLVPVVAGPLNRPLAWRRVVPLEEAIEAHEYCQKGHVRGKVVLRVKQM